MSKFIQVSTAYSNKEDALKISDMLVKEKLCACTQIIGPINSIYWWDDKINNTEEWLCLIKSNKILYSKIEKFLKKSHPYKVPEIICIDIKKGSKEYLDWLKFETKNH